MVSTCTEVLQYLAVSTRVLTQKYYHLEPSKLKHTRRYGCCLKARNTYIVLKKHHVGV